MHNIYLYGQKSEYVVNIQYIEYWIWLLHFTTDYTLYDCVCDK